MSCNDQGDFFYTKLRRVWRYQILYIEEGSNTTSAHIPKTYICERLNLSNRCKTLFARLECGISRLASPINLKSDPDYSVSEIVCIATGKDNDH